MDAVRPAGSSIRHARHCELILLHGELESHLDPKGEIYAARMRRFNDQRAAALHAQGKHHEAEQWLMPKEKWEPPAAVQKPTGPTSSSRSIGKATKSP